MQGSAGAQWERAGAALYQPLQTLHGPKLSQKEESVVPLEQSEEPEALPRENCNGSKWRMDP